VDVTHRVLTQPERPCFEQVESALGSMLRRYLERMVGNPADADDLLQETLLKIANGLANFEGRSQVKTWAFRIANRVAIDFFRKPQNSMQVVAFTEERYLSQAFDPSSAIVFDEMNACMREVIDQMPIDYRGAIILHDLQGLTAAETAQVQGCSLATAKIRIHRARKRLSKALRKQCDFYHDQEQVLRCTRKP